MSIFYKNAEPIYTDKYTNIYNQNLNNSDDRNGWNIGDNILTSIPPQLERKILQYRGVLI